MERGRLCLSSDWEQTTTLEQVAPSHGADWEQVWNEAGSADSKWSTQGHHTLSTATDHCDIKRNKRDSGSRVNKVIPSL
jgi:hypothetical protein